MNWLGRKLCAHGYHSFAFAEMYNRRMVSVGPYSDTICTIVDICRRPACRLRRTRESAKIPKRVRT